MNLVFRRSQKQTMWGYYRFELQARFDLTTDERGLVGKYGVENTVLADGDPMRDLQRSAKWAAPGALIAMAAGFWAAPLHLGGQTLTGTGAAALAGLLGFALLTVLIYNQIREEIRIQDMLTGRFFRCRSVLRLVAKERLLLAISADFCHFLEAMRTWDGREVIPIELPPKPGLHLDPPRHEAA